MVSTRSWVFLCLLSCTLPALYRCKKQTPESIPFTFKQPDYFPAAAYTFEGNELNSLRFSLGRQLFYDPILSSDSTISCASCHQQMHAFAGHGTAFSVGVNNQVGTRNSPSLANLAWYPNFMWDGGINHLEVMPIAPITNPVEMNETMANVLVKLNRSDFYRSFFLRAYGVQEINSQSLLRALSQFNAMLVSDGSKYDQMRRGEITFTNSEAAGYSLFQQKCATCHTEPLFTDFSYRNNGLDSVFNDPGRAAITLSNADMGKFKVPALRNVEITYPYMHDGRFGTLEAVLDHYSAHIKSTPTLDPQLAGNIPLTPIEKSNIISFLKTLTDHKLLTDHKFSEPH